MRRLTYSAFRFRRETLSLALGLGLLAVLAFLPSTGHTAMSWRGDFETGTFSQWDYGVQQKAPGRATIVTAPLRQERYAARFEVRPGDNNVAGSGNGERTEALIKSATTEGSEGREAYWAWSTYFPADFDAPMGGWNAFTQFHHTGSTGGTNMHFAVSDMKSLTLRVMGGDFDAPQRKDFVLASLQKGSWYDFVFHVKWSSNPSIGFVEMWVNGNRVVPKTFTPTLYPGMTAYAKQGYYRAAHTGTTVVYHDGMRRGSSYEEVAAEFPSGGAGILGVTSSIATGSTLSGTAEWTATPSGKTASSVAFSVDGSIVWTDTTAPFKLSLDTTKLANGPHVFRVDATATDGSKAFATATATVSNEIVAPLAVQQNLVDGQTVSGSIPWTATTSGKAVSKVEFSVNGQLIGTDTGSSSFGIDDDIVGRYTVTLDTKRLANGAYPFAVKAFATVGTTATATVTATVSNQIVSPLSVQQSLVNGQTVSGSIPWTATTSGKAVSKVEFSVNGQSIATDTESPYSVTLDTKRFANGAYPFAVKAFAADGTMATATATATVSNEIVAPLAINQNLVNDQTVSGSIPWTATTFGKSVSKVEFSVNGQSIATDTESPYSVTLDTKRFANGAYPFAVKAFAADGTTATATATVKVANSAATSFSVMQNLSEGLNLAGTFKWSAVPTGGRVTNVVFSIDGEKVAEESRAPYELNVNTRKLSNGKHTFTARALADDGSTVSTSADVIVANKVMPQQPSTALDVSQSISNGQTLSGSVSWTATTRGTAANKIEFFIDGSLSWTERHAPYVYRGDGAVLDTREIANGTHVLEVRADAADGSSAKATATVLVSNGATSPGAGSGNHAGGDSGNHAGGDSGNHAGGDSDNSGSDSGNNSGTTASPELVSSIRDRQTVSGHVTWSVDPRGFTVSRVEFFIDSKLMWTERVAPFVYGGDDQQLDTRTLRRGAHFLEVRAVGTDGSIRTLKLRVTVM